MDFSYRFTIDNQELILERCDLAFLNTIDQLPDGTDPGVLYKLFSISALNLYKIPTENENFHKIEEFFKNVEDDSDTNITISIKTATDDKFYDIYKIDHVRYCRVRIIRYEQDDEGINYIFELYGVNK